MSIWKKLFGSNAAYASWNPATWPSAGGLSSGIDLGLRVVERYFGCDVATKTAYRMKYLGEGWSNPDSNSAYAKLPGQASDHAVCPVCRMDADVSLKSVYKGKTFYFRNAGAKQTFDDTPDRSISGLEPGKPSGDASGKP